MNHELLDVQADFKKAEESETKLPISVEPLKNAREFQQTIYFCFIHYAPPSMGLSRQEHWSGLPFPSPMHESEK